MQKWGTVLNDQQCLIIIVCRLKADILSSRASKREEEGREREREGYTTPLPAMLLFVVAVDHCHVTCSRPISQSHFDDVILYHHRHHSLIRLVYSAFHSD